MRDEDVRGRRRLYINAVAADTNWFAGTVPLSFDFQLIVAPLRVDGGVNPTTCASQADLRKEEP